MDGQTDMTMVLVDFRNFAKPPRPRNANIEYKTLYLLSTTYCFQCCISFKNRLRRLEFT
jgi:hypothetical protein